MGGCGTEGWWIWEPVREDGDGTVGDVSDETPPGNCPETLSNEPLASRCEASIARF